MNNEPDYNDNLYFEEKKMQKTPEVGDVWIDGYKRKILVADVYDLKNNGFAECITTDIYRPEVLKARDIKFDTFQFLTYLGKSKANIDDLFKTENEE